MTERMTPEAAMGVKLGCACSGWTNIFNRHSPERCWNERDKVESQINHILDNWQSDATPPGLVVELKKLVSLVRQEKA